MKISQITEVIERFAPLGWQESYDNAGLIVGRPDDEVHKALLAVDVTEEVLDEAEAEGCDIVLTHHPIVFHALKRFNSADPVQRCVERAIRSPLCLPHQPRQRPRRDELAAGRDAGRREPRSAATRGSRRRRGVRRGG